MLVIGVIATSEMLGCIIAGHLFTAAGLATLEVLEEENLCERSESISRCFLQQLGELRGNSELIGDVRGRSLLVGLSSDVLEITPPLVVEKADVDHGIAILAEAIRDVLEGKMGDEVVARFAGW